MLQSLPSQLQSLPDWLKPSPPPAFSATLTGGYSRLAQALADRGDPELAEQAFEQSLRVATGAPHEHQARARCHIAGHLHRHGPDDARGFADGIGHYGAALSLADPQRQGPAAFRSAVRALCRALGQPPGCGPCRDQDLVRALQALDQAEPEASGRPAAQPHCETLWRRWLRALILQRFGAERRAEGILEACRRHLLRLENAPLHAAVAVDLGMLYQGEERWTDLQRLTTEAVMHFRTTTTEDAKAARSALLLWRDAALHEDLDDDLYRFVRARVVDWALAAGIRSAPE